MKKIIALTLALIMVMSMGFSVSALNLKAADYYEAEELTLAAKQGEVSIIESSAFSGGKAYQLIATKGEEWVFNDYIRLYAPIWQRGWYKIKAKVRKGPDCGIIQLWFSDTNLRVGEKIDMYSPTEEIVEVEFGTAVCDLGETRWFEFRPDGKNEKSSGYNFVIDTLDIVFDQPYEAPGALYPNYNDVEPTAEPETGYEWGQVMEGGTGCSTHLLFHPKEAGLMYMGTDMGGAYRWDNNNYTWIPITDNFSVQQAQDYTLGIDGMALDPNNPDILYIAFGMYANKTENYLGHVMKSYDRGDTWEDTGFTAYFCANGDYRNAKECIAVDPNNSNVVMCSTMDGRLVRSTDGFKTWTEIPVPFETTKNGVCPRGILYDVNSGDANGSKRIYLGTTGAGLWVSEDYGANWSRVNGCNIPETGVIWTINMSNDGTILIGTSKDLFKMDKNGTWSIVSPVAGKRFQTSMIYPSDSNLMVTTWHHGPVGSYGEYAYKSTDGGKSWTLLNDTLIRNNYIPRVEYNGFFANTTTIAMDPFNKNRAGFTGWQNFYLTENLWDENVKITNYTKGVEHGCLRYLHTLPVGARLIVDTYDYLGGRFTDVTQHMPNMLPPKNSNPATTAFSEGNPNYVVRIGKDVCWYSTDNGLNWRMMESCPVAGQYSFSCAVSNEPHPETGNYVVYALYGKSAPAVTFDNGKTWTISNAPAFPADSKWNRVYYLTVDQKDPNVVYYMSNADKTLYKSEDYGVTYKAITTMDSAGKIETMPGTKYLFAINGGKLMYSSTQGDLFKYLEGDFDKVVDFAFGKEEKAGDPMTIYVVATKGGVYGIYRSQDMGKNWTKIYDESTTVHHKIPIIGMMAADRQQFGIIYVGGSGRGIFYGAPDNSNIFYQIRDDDIKVLINGQTVMFDVSPQLINDRTMVPMRKIFEDVGAVVEWDEATQTVTAKRHTSDTWDIYTTEVKLTIGEKTIYINGVPQEIDVAPVVINDRTLVPVRFISEALGAKVEWLDESQVVKITM